MVEVITHNAKQYQRIDPSTIDLEQMTEVQKVTDVFARQVKEKETLEINGESYPVDVGDWIVYNIGNGVGETFKEKLATSDVHIIHDEAFQNLYELKQDTTNDDSTYADYDGSIQGDMYGYHGRSIFVARVPFNFVIKAPWGKDQYIERNGYIVHNVNTSRPGLRDIYAIPGARGRHADQLEKTYTLKNDGNRDIIEGVYKHVIAANRSPIAGIQFNMKDLERAHKRIGLDINKREQAKKKSKLWWW